MAVSILPPLRGAKLAAPELMLRPASRSDLAEALRHWNPRTQLGRLIRLATDHLPAELAAELVGEIKRVAIMEAELFGVLLRPGRRPEPLGLLSRHLITNNGVGFIVDAWQNLVELENMKYHGYGTGTNAEAQSDSALQTELTTEYAVDNTRPTGTTTENAANIFESVATLSPDSGGTLAITEHGLFSANTAGVLFDRSKFSAINLVAGADSLQTTYRATITAGG